MSNTPGRRMRLPALTFDRLRQAQQDHNREPLPWQLIYDAGTETLAKIQRNEAGEIVFCVLEGPLTAEQAEARAVEIMGEPLPRALTVPAGVARH